MVNSSSPNAPSTLLIFLCSRTHAKTSESLTFIRTRQIERKCIIIIIIIIIIVFSGSAAQRGLWPPCSRGFLITHNDAPQSVGLLRTSDQLVAETSTWQHTQQTNVHAPGGIRTHYRSRRAAVDLRLRPRGRWDWQCSVQYTLLLLYLVLVMSYCEMGG
jgi:hypothetical protein